MLAKAQHRSTGLRIASATIVASLLAFVALLSPSFASAADPVGQVLGTASQVANLTTSAPNVAPAAGASAPTGPPLNAGAVVTPAHAPASPSSASASETPISDAPSRALASAVTHTTVPTAKADVPSTTSRAVPAASRALAAATAAVPVARQLAQSAAGAVDRPLSETERAAVVPGHSIALGLGHVVGDANAVGASLGRALDRTGVAQAATVDAGRAQRLAAGSVARQLHEGELLIARARDALATLVSGAHNALGAIVWNAPAEDGLLAAGGGLVHAATPGAAENPQRLAPQSIADGVSEPAGCAPSPLSPAVAAGASCPPALGSASTPLADHGRPLGAGATTAGAMMAPAPAAPQVPAQGSAGFSGLAGAAPSGFGTSILLSLMGLLLLGVPRTMRRLGLASESLRAAPFVLIPDRPG